MDKIPKYIQEAIRMGTSRAYNIGDSDYIKDDRIEYIKSAFKYYDDRYADNIYHNKSLTKDEKKALGEYKESAYENMNNVMRGTTLDQNGLIFNSLIQINKYIKDLLHVFEKTKVTQKDIYVYRGIKVNGIGAKAIKDEIAKTNELRLDSFTSTTINIFKTIAYGKFSGPNCCVFVIKVPAGTPVIFADMRYYNKIIEESGSIEAGRPDPADAGCRGPRQAYVSYLLSIIGEGEVILPPNSKLMIDGVYKLGDFGGNMESHMETYVGTLAPA
jgi:hypothetical protein